MIRYLFLFSVFFLQILSGCTSSSDYPGTEKNPLRLYVNPATNEESLQKNAEILKIYLEEHTPYKFIITIPENYASVVAGFDKKKVDLAFINTAGYYRAHSQSHIEARLTAIRFGKATYQSQIIVRSDAKIRTLEDLKNKTVAFVDPSSMSGYMLPLKMFKDLNIPLKKEVFSETHDEVVRKVYRKQVDAGVTYYNPPQNGIIEDARRLVKAQYPDVEKAVRILELSEPIPNDPLVFAKDLPEEMKEKIVNTILLFATSDSGKRVLNEMIGATHFKKATDADYESVRQLLPQPKIELRE